MGERFSSEQIKEFWTQQALRHGTTPAASWSDQPAIDLEIREIGKYLSDGDQILDVGCANGHSTIQLATSKKVHIRGIDYVPQMIQYARVAADEAANAMQGTVEFDVGDVGSLNEPSQQYDKVIVKRVIINLDNWDEQLKALMECVRVLKSQGILLLSEATIQGWNKLNRFRKEWGLHEIPMPQFNLYVDQGRIVSAVSSDLELLELCDFSSTYYVGTRVIKPLLIQALGIGVDVADPGMEWNAWFSRLPSWGDYGVQKLFVFRRIS